MVSLLLGQRADAVHVREGSGEVRKFDLALQMMLVDDPPARGELSLEIAQLGAFQGRNTSSAGDTFLVREVAHLSQKIRLYAGYGREAGGSVLARFQPLEVSLSQKHKPILVVDDDDAIRTMVERVLRREQFEVESARDGHEAIEKLTRNDYGTILLDLMMPRVDGLGVLRFLETHPTPARVIVMTANTQGSSEAAEARPVFRVLSKPFDITQLISHVRECSTVDALLNAPEESRYATRAAVDV